MSRQHVHQQEAALNRLIAATHRRGIALARLGRALAHLNARRRAQLERLKATSAGTPQITKGGPDWSAYQGPVNVHELAAHYDVAIRKATEATGYIDPGFARDWEMLRREPIHRGAYHFAHPSLDASAQARHFVATVKAAGLLSTDVLVADVEIDPGPGLDEWTDQFLAELHRLAPQNPVWLYTSEQWRVWKAREGRLCWVAAYNGQRAVSSPAGLQGRVVLHQFTDHATVAGVRGTCDLSCTP